MPSRPSIPAAVEAVLLRMLRQLVLVLGGMLGARAEFLRARRDRLPAGDRRRARLTAELRRLARLRALLADPEVLNDPGFRGTAAEVARVRNDAGRRALARRRLQPVPPARLRYAGMGYAAACRWADRCITVIGAA